MEIDVRWLTRIRRPKCYLTCSVAGMAFQNHPSQAIQVGCEHLGEAGIVPPTVCQQRHAEEIRWAFRPSRLSTNSQNTSVGGINTAAVFRQLRKLRLCERTG